MTLCTSYFNRPRQWQTTLESLKFWYGDAPWLRISVQDDSSSDRLCKGILEHYPWPYKYEYVDRTDKKFRNPSVLFNRAVELADDGLICLTNPENLHMGAILGEARSFEPGTYTVYGCRPSRQVAAGFGSYIEQPIALIDTLIYGGWYQHTINRNCLLHFCSVLWKQDYVKLGGFDPAYDDGAAFDDNDFAEKVLASDLKVTVKDRPYVIHQWHERPTPSPELTEAEQVNGKLFLKKWGYEPRRFVKVKKGANVPV